jgi:hypothetical protein
MLLSYGAVLGICREECNAGIEVAGGGRMVHFPSFKFLVLGTILVLFLFLVSVSITDSLIKSALTSPKPTAGVAIQSDAQSTNGTVAPSPQTDAPSAVGSNTDGWRVYIDISSPEGREQQGFLPTRFNSKELCAITADGVFANMKSLGFNIDRIECRRG